MVIPRVERRAGAGLIVTAVTREGRTASALLISSGGALAVTFFALFLRESAPSKVGGTRTVVVP
ncbi:hypothetical protein [Corynebacterium marinum]|uniref:Uncharacterized protein n=1 Tax=Corynebacterium marinum DSM 44953 TaxID=1224162 RepID=A0A0B6TSC1_9CORY|nr:hypothetical protein [Corynebacterium marinum]AJK68475.1 hypothetical protein B840_04280 [Corynebacterium marinum DSM 44953]GGO15071.1 hypothetical protein GCM10010980_10120 [Corynebacterium marinum]